MPAFTAELQVAGSVALNQLQVVISVGNRAVRAALLLSALSWRPAALLSLLCGTLVVLSSTGSMPVRSAPVAVLVPAHRQVARPIPPQQVEHPAPPLPPAVEAPLPAPPALAAEGPLATHEIFGFAPYWTLDRAAGFDLRSLSTVAYFGLDVNADGSLVRSGGSWDGYQSQALAELISRGHRNSDRMVLTIKAFDAPTLHRLASDPAVPARLSAEVIEAIRAKSFDGLNIDFEGQGSQDRAALAALVRNLAGAVHGANPAWQVTVDSYASSATDVSGWFDVAAMAPSVDAFFVMAYDMHQQDAASPNSPLHSSRTSVSSAGAAYAAAVGRGKVIMGVPYYGYDWQTDDNQPGSHAAHAPAPVDYASIRNAGRPEFWDPDHQVPWTSYQDGPRWHEVYYDNPVSLALKAREVAAMRLLGIGVWALGMDGNDPTMMAALLGHARPLKPAPAPAPPAAPTTSVTPTHPAPAAAPAATPKATPHPSGSPSPSPSSSPSPSPSPPVPLPGVSPAAR
ncbi:MAG: hypothetical protein NVSMB17_08220 [Candidatus Dormibacteria bacterium]